ncbi:dTDP-4-dehydrorhamnose 3,5-epimerase [Enterobacter asburiae]|uniref:dTDP-4-dehydrorhamnose 3,5-epimerase n=1 Tax=Enterobacter asburiae TaxID=61645 RepID=A0A7W3DHR8_ENTAS|nr:dTDP-4-dehydrorhamnose 3,5-epimerase [Enterobacter asburiae]CAE7099787.1 dTDP-4-dehydrorhamnose 3%2C5-epimerase [Enterobacter cloacae]AKK99404.1 dTDP-4-dehydrorhamnose 3,5-epimerase [Enterobacter asburiae]MBA7988715.1 dTDP-4-dehydrorhamnose 3,5-epimerase [Enterobacter asburiae]MBA8078850.1 dTDP-4-dehydrorhamnose 3,5-epimerase [Enterobacter asburiae]MBJ6585392.1 dTDP-4-dehydrorhamnose 3,5-epimerase [Enterobacter asburiae]
MNVIKTNIPDVLIFEPTVFGDERGFFMESYNQQIFEKAVGRKVKFVQDNHSKSSKGVLRGLHYQLPPFAQAKLVRCVVGEVYDVAVDIRRDSPSYAQWVGVKLSAENKRQLWIPEGFAHGFLVLSEVAEFVYKTNNYYMPEYDNGILWNDSRLNINWGCDEGSDFKLSTKDKSLPLFSDANVF